MLKKIGNIGSLISADLTDFIKNYPEPQWQVVYGTPKHGLSKHPFKKWENVKQYLHGYDEVSQYSTELHEIHSVYSIYEFKVDLEEFEKAHLQRHKFYPAVMKFDMALTDKVQPILDYLNMDYAIIKTTYQPPGALYPVHYDQMHSSKYIFESISSASIYYHPPTLLCYLSYSSQFGLSLNLLFSSVHPKEISVFLF